MHFTLESDRDVTVAGVGLLEAGVSVTMDEQMSKLFELTHGTTVARANFAPYVQVTAVIGKEE